MWLSAGMGGRAAPAPTRGSARASLRPGAWCPGLWVVGGAGGRCGAPPSRPSLGGSRTPPGGAVPPAPAAASGGREAPGPRCVQPAGEFACLRRTSVSGDRWVKRLRAPGFSLEAKQAKRCPVVPAACCHGAGGAPGESWGVAGSAVMSADSPIVPPR